MKKIVIALGCLVGLGAPIIAATGTPATMVMADGGETSQTAEPAPETSKTAEPEQKQGWDLFVEKYLTADKVAMYMSWAAYVGTIVGLAVALKRLFGKNQITLKDVKSDVTQKIEEVVGNEVKLQTERFLPSVIEAQEKTNEILKGFSKILALSQENSPESRVAILQIIEQLGTTGKELTEAAKDAIHEEVALAEEHKAEIEGKLDEIIEEYDGTSI